MASKNLSTSPNPSRFHDSPGWSRSRAEWWAARRLERVQQKSSDSDNSKALNVGISRNMTGTSLNFESEEFQDWQWTNVDQYGSIWCMATGKVQLNCPSRASFTFWENLQNGVLRHEKAASAYHRSNQGNVPLPSSKENTIYDKTPGTRVLAGWWIDHSRIACAAELMPAVGFCY